MSIFRQIIDMENTNKVQAARILSCYVNADSIVKSKEQQPLVTKVEEVPAKVEEPIVEEMVKSEVEENDISKSIDLLFEPLSLVKSEAPAALEATEIVQEDVVKSEEVEETVVVEEIAKSEETIVEPAVEEVVKSEAVESKTVVDNTYEIDKLDSSFKSDFEKSQAAKIFSAYNSVKEL